MASDQHRTTVGDYVTLVRGTTYKGELVGEPGPALLGLGSIEPGGGFRIGKYKTYGGDCPDELMLFPGDIYASLKGATKDGKMIGSVARVPNSVPRGRLTQDTVKLVFRHPDLKDATFLYWVLRTPHYREYCAGRATGSAVVALSRRDFLSYPVPPPTSQRRKLADLLNCIEEKIESNRRMAVTAEAIARALFKSWFVDFDPVRAKMEGRDPDLPPHIAALFPDRLVATQKGEVPEGWSPRTLADFTDLNPEVWTKHTRPEEINYVDLSNTKWGRIETITPYHQSEAPSRAKRVLRPNDTIVGTVRPGNGSYAFISDNGLTGSTGFAQLRPRQPEFAELVYLAATAPENIEALAHLADGAAYPAVRPEVVAATSVAQSADRTLLCQFSEHTRPLLARSAQNIVETRALAAVRDALLPKFTSGELHVKDAETLLNSVP